MWGMLGSDSTLSLGSGEVEESLRLSVLSELCLRTLALLELELEPRTKAGAKAKAWDTRAKHEPDTSLDRCRD
jgi:hypothetical protein